MSKSLVLVDLQHHAEGGHFATWLRKALTEACKYWPRIVIYTADSFSMSDLAIPKAYEEQVDYFSIRRVHNESQHKGDILGVLARHQEKYFPEMGKPPFFIMWAQQHAARGRLHRERWFRRMLKQTTSFDRIWGSLFSLSSLVYDDPMGKPHPLEHKVSQTVKSDSSCVGMLVWDENAARHFGEKCIYLPDVEEICGDDNWSFLDSKPVVLGSVGQLWGYRSINMLAEILESEPEVSGFAAGSLFFDSYSKKAKRMIMGKSGGLSLERGFIPDDVGLRRALARLDAFVIDSRTYKVPSGLAIRAMSMGRPIVTIDRDSWIARHIKSSGVGVFWQKGRGSLRAELREWFESGGPARSKALAGKLSDQAGMEAAFAEMFRRLKEAAAEN
jgi:glycosyltransferase involved in cell wall biosynthesis